MAINETKMAAIDIKMLVINHEKSTKWNVIEVL